jgi:ABC-type maltose transport system permease subunit
MGKRGKMTEKPIIIFLPEEDKKDAQSESRVQSIEQLQNILNSIDTSSFEGMRTVVIDSIDERTYSRSRMAGVKRFIKSLEIMEIIVIMIIIGLLVAIFVSAVQRAHNKSDQNNIEEVQIVNSD